ncbi:hypothetical protein V757_04715 [Pelistega indica]|uniref:Thiamine biosynthesis protein ThiS n=1 Tax=Pelistega indica TaxID=1414851 RepID=V8G8B9_9BURK|nr:hypothetical protein [Pelistega indica]ETD72351.1 hypothetical protein V757_04715 [Pelistega indica]
MSAITVFINGQPKDLLRPISLEEFVVLIQTELQQENNPKAIATAVNEVFIPRTQRSSYIPKK